MSSPLNPQLFVPVGIGALILWRFYARMRRMIGRQTFSSRRPWITVCIFPILGALLVVASLKRPESLGGLAAGIAVGIGLGIYGLKATKFESTPEGMFYTPSAHVGIALSLLLAARILYRFFQVSALGGAPPDPHMNYATTPLTMVIFGTLAGYYVTYAIGLIRWHQEVVRSGSPKAADPR